MKLTKGRAYLVSTTASLVVGVVAMAFGYDSSGATLAAIVSISVAYIGGNVADNGVKGRYFNKELEGK